VSPSRAERGVASPPAERSAALPPGFVLLAAVVAMSWSGPLVRFATAPAIVVAAWRLVFSVAFIALVLFFRRTRSERPGRRDTLLMCAGGVLLAAHFWSWIASIGLTSISSSVVLVSTQPVFVGLISMIFLRERPSVREWTGIALGVGGAAIIGWGDFGRGRDALIGDLLAIAGAVFVSAYYVIGRGVRRRLDLWRYIFVVYGSAAIVLLAVAALLPATPLTGYPGRDWLVFFGLAAGPMMIGHTGINYALRYVPAYIANLAILGEPVGATLIAWLLPAIAEVPGPKTVAGAILVLAGIAVGATGRRSARPTAPAVAE
jgi:drug/metabolite transporter (DMT)-like permease